MENIGFKEFLRNTYRSGNPIPVIITVQSAFFIGVYALDLLFELKLLPTSYLKPIAEALSLPDNLTGFLQKPWSFLTTNIVYVDPILFVFDTLWLYWIGNTFMTFLKKTRFLFVYLTTWLISNALYVGMGTLFHTTDTLYLTGGAMPLAAILAAVAVLLPNYEQPLVLFGNVKLKVIAVLYFALEFLYFSLNNRPAAIAYAASIIFGMAFTYALKAGFDWSARFQRQQVKAPRMKVVVSEYSNNTVRQRQHEVPHITSPSQAEIDMILDKISISGYESLSSHEKETLFRASNSSNKVDG